ncbi:MAG: molecular chaperone HtpG [Clostridiales bacterium]|nr:MAG: molecular chaperone HtpG [Clostridiales bacterium]
MAKKQFKTESKRILDMMINSVYTHREIFLRELISNASDAIDKLAYRALTDESVKTAREDFRIQIKPDKDARTLTISDNGIGMSADELESNLGVIARSGSYAFKNDLTDKEKEDKTVEIIGQFGVGFYSAFMVAEKVRVVSRKFGEDTANAWESTGADGYTVSPAERAEAGTDVILFIKPDTEDERYGDYLDTYELKRIVKKYSDYIRFPIVMDVEKSRPVESDEVDEDGKKKTTYETYTEAETVNSMVPIWQRPKSEVSDEDCCAFYKEKYYDNETPLKVIRIEAEGLIAFKAMLFIPAAVPYGYYTKDFEKGLQLYSNGVMIIDKCAELLPEHFRFVKGVVDSDNLSLNISRELLQHDKQLRVIAQNIEKRIKRELKKMMEDEPETYDKFYKQFGLQLKYGVVSDFGAHRELLSDLLMFATAKSDKLVTLEEYCNAMPEEQKYIYYACGENIAKVSALPQIERLRAKDFDVLYMTDEVDEFVVEILGQVNDKQFKNVSRDDLELETEEEKKETEQKNEDNKALLDFVKETLGGEVSAVRISHKLVSHPVCLTSEGSVTLEMEKYFASIPGENKVKAQRVLELNGDHAVFAQLKNAFEADRELAAKYAKILYSQALLIAGFPLEDPAGYSELVCGLLR